MSLKIITLFLVVFSCQKPMETKSEISENTSVSSGKINKTSPIVSISNLTFLILDVSRSMDESNKLREGKAFLSKASSLLKNNGDQIIVLLTGKDPSIANLYRFKINVPEMDLTRYSEHEKKLKQIVFQNQVNLEAQNHLVSILKLIKMERRDGSTELIEGIQYISRLPEFKYNGIKRLYIFSDGQENSKKRTINKLKNLTDGQIIQHAEQDAQLAFPKNEISDIREVTLQVPRENQKITSRDLQIAQVYWEAFFKSQEIPITVTSDIQY